MPCTCCGTVRQLPLFRARHPQTCVCSTGLVNYRTSFDYIPSNLRRSLKYSRIDWPLQVTAAITIRPEARHCKSPNSMQQYQKGIRLFPALTLLVVAAVGNSPCLAASIISLQHQNHSSPLNLPQSAAIHRNPFA